jgi:hypothetical protein
MCAVYEAIRNASSCFNQLVIRHLVLTIEGGMAESEVTPLFGPPARRSSRDAAGSACDDSTG